jgi:ubiquinol-cytochrome c reductase cytochrome b subunit
LFLLPFIASFKTKTSKFIKITQFLYWLFISNVIFLGILGACIVEQPYIVSSQLGAIFYFSYFLVILPVLRYIDNKIINDDINLFWGLHWL